MISDDQLPLNLTRRVFKVLVNSEFGNKCESHHRQNISVSGNKPDSCLYYIWQRTMTVELLSEILAANKTNT